MVVVHFLNLSSASSTVCSLFIAKNAIESVLSSFADVFFCSLPIHRLFSKSPDKSGNYIIFENTNCIFRVYFSATFFNDLLPITYYP